MPEAAPEMLDALKLAQRALNTAPRFRVGDTDSYAIAAVVDKAIAAAPPPARDATPDFRADVVASLMAEMEAFSDEFSRQARTKEQKVLAAGFETFVGVAHKSIVYIAEASREHGRPGTPQVSDPATNAQRAKYQPRDNGKDLER